MKPGFTGRDMYSSETRIRVRYAETDQMGFVYYGHYFTYYEVARVESLRNLGYTYKDLEASGIMLPVKENHMHFIKPAKYDELLTVKATVPQLPSVKLYFEYEIFNRENDLINTGKTLLVFMNKDTEKPTRPPKFMLDLFRPYF